VNVGCCPGFRTAILCDFAHPAKVAYPGALGQPQPKAPGQSVTPGASLSGSEPQNVEQGISNIEVRQDAFTFSNPSSFVIPCSIFICSVSRTSPANSKSSGRPTDDSRKTPRLDHAAHKRLTYISTGRNGLITGLDPFHVKIKR
jgi:hypothetical protein